MTLEKKTRHGSLWGRGQGNGSSLSQLPLKVTAQLGTCHRAGHREEQWSSCPLAHDPGLSTSFCPQDLCSAIFLLILKCRLP